MSDKPYRLDEAVHLKQGKALFNHVWDLMEKPDRTPHETELMLHAAHASRWHWEQTAECRPVNRARGEWQVSRAYAVAGRAEPARHHAQVCLDLCLEHGIGDFDLAFAYEALTRAARVAGDAAAQAEYARLAAEAGAKIAEADDRKHFENELSTASG